jgi:enterochelin esterase-like enzyme
MENQIEVETTVIDGEHTWDVWRNRLAYVLTQIYGE